MPTKNKTVAASAASPLDSEKGRDWLGRELAASQRELQTGPDNLGWRFNEHLRHALEERIAFLEALIALLPR
ncbi:hypothetical protein EV701_123101 [Chthoniobacter flavus]|uniref:hypothetical protein n=1 Tax=Chthoniobacter flavus TaxID=191863 RepID=UPI0010520B41|nr:hypothetical protein [Chthoniobacter flavus]TCO87264.1 hypothetical protein EV701_123101 [Chthoniobacter flavus]